MIQSGCCALNPASCNITDSCRCGDNSLTRLEQVSGAMREKLQCSISEQAMP